MSAIISKREAFLVPQVMLKPDSVGAGTWAWSISVLQLFAGWFTNNSGANNDNCTMKVFLTPGTYTLCVLYVKAADRGILKVYLGSQVLTTIDGYAAAISYNNIDETTSITISSSGVQNLKFEVDGKNASSSNYYVTFTAISLKRTS